MNFCADNGFFVQSPINHVNGLHSDFVKLFNITYLVTAAGEGI